jgi:hypothetical protein
MQSSPLDSQRQGSGRQHTIQKADRREANLGGEGSVVGMEMWRLVIVEVHLDDDSEKTGDLGHDGPT